MVEKNSKYCSGVRTSGYWKGAGCCAIAKIQTEDGQWWCKNHVPLNVKVVQILENRKK